MLDQLDVAESLSFPSGHAMVGFILYMLAAHFLAENVKSNGVKLAIGFLAFVIVLLIRLSRIVLQAHFPTDVLGGYRIGAAWTHIMDYFFIIGCMNGFLKNRSDHWIASIFLLQDLLTSIFASWTW